MVNFLHPKQLLMTAVLLLASISSFAYDFEVDGIYYNKLSENTVEVTYKELGENTNWYSVGYEDKATITIPSTVTYGNMSYTVTSIGNYAFRGCSGLTSINIPMVSLRLELLHFGAVAA